MKVNQILMLLVPVAALAAAATPALADTDTFLDEFWMNAWGVPYSDDSATLLRGTQLSQDSWSIDIESPQGDGLIEGGIFIRYAEFPINYWHPSLKQGNVEGINVTVISEDVVIAGIFISSTGYSTPVWGFFSIANYNVYTTPRQSFELIHFSPVAVLNDVNDAIADAEEFASRDEYYFQALMMEPMQPLDCLTQFTLCKDNAVAERSGDLANCESLCGDGSWGSLWDILTLGLRCHVRERNCKKRAENDFVTKIQICRNTFRACIQSADVPSEIKDLYFDLFLSNTILID